MLRKLNSLLAENGILYITTAINAPTVDHIFLFRNKDEVINMVTLCGFEVVDYTCAAANDIEMSKAMIKRRTISIALFLKKRKEIK